MNQTRLIPVYVDIVTVRSPRKASTDANVLLRAIYNELFRSFYSGKIEFRKDKRRSASLKARVIYRSLNDRVAAVVRVRKRLKGHYVRMEFVRSQIRKRSILYVVTPREVLFEDPSRVLLDLEEPVMTLYEASKGYKAVVLVVEDLKEYVPSRKLLDALKNDVYVLDFDSEKLAYRPLRYTI